MDEYEKQFEGFAREIKFDDSPSFEHRDRLEQNLLDAFSKQTPRQIEIWRIIMKSNVTKLAVAAVIIAVLIGINHFGGSIDAASTVWANTLEQIYKATSVTFKSTFYVNDNEPFTTEEMVNENGIKRSSHNDVHTIFDFGGGKDLQLMPWKKEATLTYRIGEKRPVKPYNQLGWFISIKDRTEEYLGIEDIDGIPAKKFFWKNGEYYHTTVWIDPSTNLPVKVEQVSLPNPDESIVQPSITLNLADFGGPNSESTSVIIIIGGGKGIQNKMVVVMTDFVWNKQLDPALFSLEPPEDYTLRESQFDASEPSENDLIKALAFWTEMSGGYYPEKINDLIDPNQINPMLIEKFNGDGDPLEELDLSMKQANIILKGVYFAFEKKADGIWGYTDKEVLLGDSDLAVCWWKSEDSETYRVIYGDLSIGSTTIENILELSE